MPSDGDFRLKVLGIDARVAVNADRDRTLLIALGMVLVAVVVVVVLLGVFGVFG